MNSHLPSSISAWVRCLMNTGFPRHFTVIVLPNGIPPMSNSAEERASTSAEAAMFATNLITASLAVLCIVCIVYIVYIVCLVYIVFIVYIVCNPGAFSIYIYKLYAHLA